MSWVEILANIPTNAVLRQKLEEVTAEFERLEGRIAELEQENASLRSQLDLGGSDLNEIEIQILEVLGLDGDYVPEGIVQQRLGIPRAKAKHYLNALEERSYLLVAHNMMTGARYKLAQLGSSYLIETGRL